MCDKLSETYIYLFFLQRLLFRDSFEFIEPLGLFSLAAFIEEKGYKAAVFSGTLTEAVSILERDIDKISAVGLYCDFENVSAVESFSSCIKERWNIPVIVGGPQSVALGKEFLSASRCDIIARGEGEYTLWYLLEYFFYGNKKLTDIPSITYLDEDSNLIKNPQGELIKNLDSLPFPKSSCSLTGKKNNISIMTGRGCPFSCAFCYQSGIEKNVRLRSVGSVIEEIKYCLKDNPHARYIWFADDTFTLNEKRMKDFCRELSLLRRERDFVWFCEGHPATLVKWPHMIKEMVSAGLVRMQIGIETGSKSVIDKYNKKTTLEEIEEAVRLCHEAGLPQLCGNIIIGGAFENKDTLEETAEFIRKIMTVAPGMVDIGLTLFMPFPCTTMTDNPEKFGMKIIDNMAVTSTCDYPVVETEELNLFDIARGRKEVFYCLLKTMRDLLKKGMVPHKYIKEHYRLSINYGIGSFWHNAVYGKDTFLNRYYKLLVKTSAKTMEDIGEKELYRWKPLRVFMLSNALSWDNFSPDITGYILSPLEYELMLLCSGKISLEEIIEIICEKFNQRFDSRQEGEELIYNIIKKFQRKHWIVFVPS